MSERKDIPRDTVPDGRTGQTGGYEPFEHKVDSPSPYDKDEMSQFKVPDCAYKGYDTFTWPEGKASEEDLPCHMRSRQDDDYEDMKPSKR